MAGIYVHIPFCKKRCNYCDFYSTIKIGYLNEYLEALSKEIEIQANYFRNEEVETIYFGGGTPSILKTIEIEKLINSLKKIFNISKNPEVTLELNPDDCNNVYLKNIKSNGVNRISIGVQSFDDKILELMGRRHTVKQVYKCIDYALNAEIQNISIDLIYDLPEMNLNAWETTLGKAFKLPIQHLSAYHLTYEKGTIFNKWLMNGKLFKLNDEESWLQFEMLHNHAITNKFEHYEISNFAKAGFSSKHNSNYWNGSYYLGLGPSAHSYNGNSRQWNCSNLIKYNKLLISEKLAKESENLTKKDNANEYILTGLRTNIGINIEFFRNNYGEIYFRNLLKGLEKFVVSKHAEIKGNFGFLTLKGWFISDKIIGELMI